MELQLSMPAARVSNAAGDLDAVSLEDERVLVERARQDRLAFAELYRAHYRAIAGYIHRRVGDAHVTEDLVADVFTAALQALPRYRQRGLPIRAWFYRIASNRVNRWVRQARRHAKERLTAEPVDHRPSSTETRITKDYARAALLNLAPKHQTVLALHYLEGMPIAEVALAVGCRVGTVKSRLSRGREALRRQLEKRRSQS